MMCVFEEFFGNHAHKSILDFSDIFPGRNSGTVCESKNMRINRHGWFAKCSKYHWLFCNAGNASNLRGSESLRRAFQAKWRKFSSRCRP